MAAANVDLDITLLNDLANAGIRFAHTNSWDDISEQRAVHRVLICLPSGFRGYERVISVCERTTVAIYRNLRDIVNHLKNATAVKTVIFVTPTSDDAYTAEDWQGLSMALIGAARSGAKLYALSGPRGEQAWQTHRRDTKKMFNIIRESAAANQGSVVTLYSEVPSISEPFACLGENSRPYPGAVYPAKAVKSFLAAVQNYVAPYVQERLYEFREEPLGRKAAYRDKRRRVHEEERGARNFGWRYEEGGARGGPRSRENNDRMQHRRGSRGRFAPYSKYCHKFC